VVALSPPKGESEERRIAHEMSTVGEKKEKKADYAPCTEVLGDPGKKAPLSEFTTECGRAGRGKDDESRASKISRCANKALERSAK